MLPTQRATDHVRATINKFARTSPTAVQIRCLMMWEKLI